MRPNNSSKPTALRSRVGVCVWPQRSGLTQALGSIKNTSQIGVLTFALTITGAGAIAYGFDQWLVYLYVSQNIHLVAILRDGAYGLFFLTAIATTSFVVGSLASKRRLTRVGSGIAAVAALISYLVTNYAAQHMTYALLSMVVMSFSAPFVAGKSITSAA